jgi:hypothetical protein
MNLFTILAVAVVILIIAAGVFFGLKRRPKELKTDRFQEQWQQLQKLLADKTQWASAILDADKLLDEALKKRHIRGKSMGERMVHAQRIFSDNDGVWFGHKLRNKIDTDPEAKLKENEVKEALLGIRQALKDLGALPSASKKTEDKDDK